MKYLYQHYKAQGKRDLFLETKAKYFQNHGINSRDDLTFIQKQNQNDGHQKYLSQKEENEPILRAFRRRGRGGRSYSIEYDDYHGRGRGRKGSSFQNYSY